MRLLGVALLAITLSGCASEAERSEWNCTHAYLTPRARRLVSASDLDAISRLIARSTDKRILAIAAVSKDEHRGILHMTVGRRDGSSPDDFGIYILDKRNGSWIITRKYEGLSVSLVDLGFHDPPD
jgi:hypothetical protein